MRSRARFGNTETNIDDPNPEKVGANRRDPVGYDNELSDVMSNKMGTWKYGNGRWGAGVTSLANVGAPHRLARPDRVKWLAKPHPTIFLLTADLNWFSQFSTCSRETEVHSVNAT